MVLLAPGSTSVFDLGHRENQATRQPRHFYSHFHFHFFRSSPPTGRITSQPEPCSVQIWNVRDVSHKCAPNMLGGLWGLGIAGGGIGPGFRLLCLGLFGGIVRAWHPHLRRLGRTCPFCPCCSAPGALARARPMEMAVLQAVIVSGWLYHAPGRSWESPSLRTAAAGDGIG